MNEMMSALAASVPNWDQQPPHVRLGLTCMMMGSTGSNTLPATGPGAPGGLPN